MGRRFLISTAAADLGALAIAVVTASLIVPEFGTFLPWRAQPEVWSLLAFLFAGALVGSYISARSWAKGAPRPSYGRAMSIVGIGVAFTAFGILATRAYWSRPFLIVTSLVWLSLALGHRALRRRRPWTEDVVAITGEKGLVEDLRSVPHAVVVDHLTPSGQPPGSPYPDGTVLAVDLRAVLSDPLAQYISSCHLAGAPVRPFTELYEEHTGRLPIIHLMEGWEVTVPLEARGLYVQAKRLIDVALVLITAPVTLLMAAAIALAIRIDSDGPVIFRQQRAGRHGKPFTMYKFRTMVVHAEENGARFAAPDDDRLTAVGRWLRRFRIDEIPQLWNVLRGDLSLVGPRPEQQEFVDDFARRIPFYTHRHLVRPGVTGWAQVNFGYADDEVDTVEKLSYDLYYIKHVSPWLDLSILGRSVWTVLSGFGAQ